jgi:hypothetical protein
MVSLLSCRTGDAPSRHMPNLAPPVTTAHPLPSLPSHPSGRRRTSVRAPPAHQGVRAEVRRSHEVIHGRSPRSFCDFASTLRPLTRSHSSPSDLVLTAYHLPQECSKRIAGGKEGDCEPWYFDYLKCIDKCVSYLQLTPLCMHLAAGCV